LSLPSPGTRRSGGRLAPAPGPRAPVTLASPLPPPPPHHPQATPPPERRRYGWLGLNVRGCLSPVCLKPGPPWKVTPRPVGFLFTGRVNRNKCRRGAVGPLEMTPAPDGLTRARGPVTLGGGDFRLVPPPTFGCGNKRGGSGGSQSVPAALPWCGAPLPYGPPDGKPKPLRS